MIASIICFIGAFFIPESPKYLISMNRAQAAKKSMKQIAKWNGTFDEIEWKDFELEIPLTHHHHRNFKKYYDVWHNL